MASRLTVSPDTAEPPHAHAAEAVAELTPGVDTPPDPEQLQQQIKLIQLCFDEHEFGVAVDEPLSPGAQAAPTQPFDAQQFVRSKVAHGVGLDVLCKDLDVFAEYVQGKIKQHVNTDLHDAFITASGRLVGMEAELQCVQKPLLATAKRVTTATNDINEVEHAMKTKLQYACDAEKERLFDATFLRGLLLHEAMVDYMEEVEPSLRADLASPSSLPDRATKQGGDDASRGASLTPARTAAPSVSQGASPQHDPDAAPTTTATTPVVLRRSTLQQLERLVQITSQLEQVVQLLPPLPHRDKDTKEMKDLAAEASDAVSSLMQQVFCRVCFQFFEQPDSVTTQQLKRVVGVYAQFNGEQRFVTMLSDAVLRPFFDAALSWKAATRARQSTRDMVCLLDDLHDSVANKLAPLLLLVRRAFQGRVMTVTALLWPALCEGLIKRLVTLYDASIPEAFHQKYTSAYRLYSLVEGLCGSQEELAALRASPDVALWNHKWNTDVYMALRQAELHKTLDAAVQQFASSAGVSKTGTTEDGASSSGYLIPPMQVLETKVAWLLSPTVFLLACAPKILRETVSAVESVLEKLVTTITADPSAPPTGAAADAPARTTTSPNHIQLFVHLLGDIARLREVGTARWLAQLRAVNAPMASTESMAAVVRLVQERLLPYYSGFVEARVAEAVVTESLPALENVRSVRLSYSHTKKPAPTQPSWYIGDCIKPFHALAHDTTQWAISSGVRETLLRDVANKLVGQFTSIATETLVTAKKTEESWEKLRKRKEATSGATTDAENGVNTQLPPPTAPHTRVTPETASDRDKMTMQLLLDLKALLGELMNCGVDTTPSTLPASATAFNLLRRAEWIMGADIPEPADIDAE